jgi:hypothetical protein
MPEIGPTAPARMFVAVRAIVPVTGIPPNRIEPILAVPCVTSSQFARCLRPDMPSATTAENNDSIAPKQCNGCGVRQHGLRLGQAEWLQARLRKASRQLAKAGSDCHDVEIKSPGKCCGPSYRNQKGRPAKHPLAQAEDDQNRGKADGNGLGVDAASRLPQGLELGQERGGLARQSEPKQLLELAGKDDDGNTGGEANRDRKGE